MAKLYLFDITNVDVDSIMTEKWDRLYIQLNNSNWITKSGSRLGFVNVQHESNKIAGYFANEGKKKAVLYNNKKEQVQPDKPYNSFEHLFFLIFEDTAQILIQSRHIYGYRDLSLSEMRKNLINLLTEYFMLSEIYVPGKKLNLESAGSKYSQEQLYKLFIDLPRITNIEIKNLFNAKIPSKDDPKYKIHNPKIERDPIVWGAISDSVDKGLDVVKMSSVEGEEGNLKGPIPKAFAGVGEILVLSGYDEKDKLIYRKVTDDEEVEIELPIEPEVSKNLIDNIAKSLEKRGRVDSWRQRRLERHSDNGLFGNFE